MSLWFAFSWQQASLLFFLEFRRTQIKARRSKRSQTKLPFAKSTQIRLAKLTTLHLVKGIFQRQEMRLCWETRSSNPMRFLRPTTAATAIRGVPPMETVVTLQLISYAVLSH